MRNSDERNQKTTKQMETNSMFMDKTTVLSRYQLIYRFSANPIKISASCFMDFNKLILKFT